MTSDSIAFLTEIFNNADAFLVIIFRLLGFFIILPIFAGANIPTVSKVGFSVTFAYIIFTSGKVTAVHYTESITGFFLLAFSEFLVGFTIGFAVFAVFSLIYFAGQLIDFQIGFSMVSVFDPVSQIQVPILGNMFYFIVCVFLILSGGLNMFISAFVASYDLIKVGEGFVIGNTAIAVTLMKLITSSLAIGVRIALPIVGSIFILDVSLGVLVKANPQMNIFVVGMPFKLLCGLGLLFVIGSFVRNMYDLVFLESSNAIVNVIGGMVK